MTDQISRNCRTRYRKGRVPIVTLLAILSVFSVVTLGGLALLLRPDARREKSEWVPIRIYCAAGVAKPVEKVVEKYNREFDARIEIVRTAGSGDLAGLIKTEYESNVEDGADIYISADHWLLAKAKKEGIIAERIPLAIQKPVIAVRADRQIEIGSLAELATQTDYSFGVASNRAAVGKLIRQIAERENVLSQLEQNKKTDSENVMVLGQALVAGSLDAAVVWDTTVNQLNQQSDQPVLRIAAYADSANEFQSEISLGIVSTTRRPSQALKFARYLASPEKGHASFRAYGFGVVEGDHWEEVPEIHLYCGSMFTPVLEERVRQFARREGVNIYPRWEGCGKLTSSIQKMEDPELFPDAYLACDRQFLDRVQHLFHPPVTLSTNDIVMVVRKELGQEIRVPKDVLDRNLRVGICDPELSALGWLTRKMFSQPPFSGFYEKLSEQAAVTVDVGPTLVSQLAAGGLDVAFVYRTNILSDPAIREKMAIVDIDDRGAQTAQATQPWAISLSSRNPQLMGRLFEIILSAETAASFRRSGFELRIDPNEAGK